LIVKLAASFSLHRTAGDDPRLFLMREFLLMNKTLARLVKRPATTHSTIGNSADADAHCRYQ
jgi:hypothetical protein